MRSDYFNASLSGKTSWDSMVPKLKHYLYDLYFTTYLNDLFIISILYKHLSFSFHFTKFFKEGTLQQNCWFSKAPPTKIQILCMFKRKVVNNLRKNS